MLDYTIICFYDSLLNLFLFCIFLNSLFSSMDSTFEGNSYKFDLEILGFFNLEDLKKDSHVELFFYLKILLLLDDLLVEDR